MSTPSNIDLFNEYTGRTFAHLYEHFPIEKSIPIRLIVGSDVLHEETANGAMKPTKECEIAFGTVKWLHETGYITATPHPYESFSNAVLTAKGLELLKLTPDALKSSIGDRLIDACKKGASESLVKLSSTALTSGLGMAFHAAMTSLS